MTILYIGYWNLSDPLTASTVFPSLTSLSELPAVKRIVFVNIERENATNLPEAVKSSKIEYHPYCSHASRNLWMEKFFDFTRGPAYVGELALRYSVDVMIARGAPAGALAWLVWGKLKIPFFIESFEPHADYMRESAVWKWYDMRYLLQKFYEKKQKTHATGLMPVADNYRTRLINEGVDEKRIFTVPCVVDPTIFSFSATDRSNVRTKLGFSADATVGIYAGRYGGLYLEDEAFVLYRAGFDFYGERFKLILLTPSVYHEWVNAKIDKHRLPRSGIFVCSVDHREVPAYLSASDFGFATYKPGKSKAFLSPVKIAEYWANGLPVLLTDGIGDESTILRKFSYAGVLFDPDRIHMLWRDYYRELNEKLVLRCDSGNSIPELVSAFRHPDRVRKAYGYFLNKFVS